MPEPEIGCTGLETTWLLLQDELSTMGKNIIQSTDLWGSGMLDSQNRVQVLEPKWLEPKWLRTRTPFWHPNPLQNRAQDAPKSLQIWGQNFNQLGCGF